MRVDREPNSSALRPKAFEQNSSAPRHFTSCGARWLLSATLALVAGVANAAEPAHFSPPTNARPIRANDTTGSVLRWRLPKVAAQPSFGEVPQSAEQPVRAASVQFASQRQPANAQPSGWNVTRAGTRVQFANNDLLEDPFGGSQVAFQQDEPIEPLEPPMAPPIAPRPRRGSFQPFEPETPPATEPEAPPANAPPPMEPPMSPEMPPDRNDQRSDSDQPNSDTLPAPSVLRRKPPGLASKRLPGCDDGSGSRPPYACAHPEGLRCLPNDFLDISPRYADLRRLREEFDRGGLTSEEDDILEKVFGDPEQAPPPSSILRQRLRDEIRTFRRPQTSPDTRLETLGTGSILEFNSERLKIRNGIGGDTRVLLRRDLHPDDEALLRSLEPHRFRTRTGRVIGDGYAGPIRQGRVTIVTDDDQPVAEVPLNELGGEELNIVARFWQLPGECLVQDDVIRERQWAPSTFTFTASALCHKPLYFEQPQIERYGHSSGPIFQPLISTGKFALDFLMLPYNMAINPPNECRYTLGHYRPGSCAPYMIPPIPLSLRGAIAEAGIIVGGVYLIP